MNKKYIKYNKMIVNIEYDKLMYSLEETQMNIIITLLPIIDNTSIVIERLYENIPVSIIYIEETKKYKANILLPKINYRDETGIFMITIKYDNKIINKYFVPPRNELLYK